MWCKPHPVTQAIVLDDKALGTFMQRKWKIFFPSVLHQWFFKWKKSCHSLLWSVWVHILMPYLHIHARNFQIRTWRTETYFSPFLATMSPFMKLSEERSLSCSRLKLKGCLHRLCWGKCLSYESKFPPKIMFEKYE